MKKFMFLLAAMAACVTASAWNYRNFVVDDVESIENGKEITQRVRLSDFVGHGKYILVDFWASWCGPCRGEVPNLKAVYDEFGGDDFEIVSVAVWDKAEDAFDAIEEEGMNWTQIVCSAKTNQIPTQVYGIEGIPYIILIDPDGKVIGEDLRGKQIRKAVKKALGL